VKLTLAFAAACILSAVWFHTFCVVTAVYPNGDWTHPKVAYAWRSNHKVFLIF
jgi:hypothetical protein